MYLNPFGGPNNKDLLVFYSFSEFFQEIITKRDPFASLSAIYWP